jgi:hypothetical protein
MLGKADGKSPETGPPGPLSDERIADNRAAEGDGEGSAAWRG